MQLKGAPFEKVTVAHLIKKQKLSYRIKLYFVTPLNTGWNTT
jgi:hypothetical protein